MEPYSYRSDPTVPDFDDSHAIIVFDGMCILCSRYMRFLMCHDHGHHFRFLPAQSALGEALFTHYGLREEDYDSVLLIADGKLRVKWDASIAFLEGLGWPWRLACCGRILPNFLSTRLYNFIAKNRIRWFGRRDVYLLPTPEDQARFLKIKTP